jgi:glycerate-2-kinase
VRAALDAVDPRTLVCRALNGAARSSLAACTDLFVCAAGKAARGMLAAFEGAAPAPIRGVVLATGPHPIPGHESVRHARAALELAGRVGAPSRFVLLLSGGASAMMALPAGGLTLDDKIATNAAMLARGIPIAPMNGVRKHLSAIKGGWLALAAGRCCTLAISDVIGEAEDDPSIIGSGPGVADPSTFGDAVRTLREFEVWDDAPEAVRAHLAQGVRGDIPETPKPADPRLSDARSFVIGSRREAMEGAREAAERLGYDVVVIGEPVLGEARAMGPVVVERALLAARRRATPHAGVCVVSSGETTVRVRGNGRGGRNQELALSALPSLRDARLPIALASVGTDGVDGPTDAAGALADGGSLARAEEEHAPTVEAALDANDSYGYFDRLGDLIRTGPTGTNVGDLQIVLIGPAA